MVPSQIKRLLKISNNNPLLSHTKIPSNHNIFLYIYIYPPLSATNSTQGQSLQIHHPYSHIGSKVHHLIFHTRAHIFIYLLFIFNLLSPLGLFQMRTKLGKVLYSMSYKIKPTQTPVPFAIRQNPNSVNLCKKT